MTGTQFFHLHHLIRRQNGPKPVKFQNPVKIRYNFFFINKLKKKFVTMTMHVLRSVCPNGSQKHMHLACLTPNPKWVICLLPAKIKFYRYFTYVSVILRAGGTLLLYMLSYQFSCCEAIPTLPVPLFTLLTPSRLFMRAKCKVAKCKVYILYKLYRNHQQKSNLIDVEPLCQLGVCS